MVPCVACAHVVGTGGEEGGGGLRSNVCPFWLDAALQVTLPDLVRHEIGLIRSSKAKGFALGQAVLAREAILATGTHLGCVALLEAAPGAGCCWGLTFVWGV